MPETVTELFKIWERVLSRIEERINDSTVFAAFFANTHIESVQGKTVVVSAVGELAVELLNKKYKDLVTRILADVTGTDFEVKFVESSSGEAKNKQSAEPAKPSFFSGNALMPSLSFENFVVGNSNRQAFQAALMVSRNPGQFYNPLLLYSDSGLGKTHLLQAIGNAIHQERPALKVLCISAADFVDEYVKFATGYKEDQSMVRWFKTEVDVFLIDDIQFLMGKKKTAEMFFIIFADLAARNKQIVITSDQHPNRLEGLDDRLRSRFSQGLVLSLERPDLATSEEILRRKIVSGGMNIEDFDPEVISFIAGRFSQNVRELEGALNRLLFYVAGFRPCSHIDMEVATEAIRGLIQDSGKDGKLTEKRIIEVVADYYNLTPSQITGKIRTSQIALARHIAMYLDKALLDTPYVKIGLAFGGKDHATVMKGVEKVENSLRSDPDMQKAISELKTKLGK
ncbi:MAG: chromosomal replication initiator protein DnaA [Bacilli bacterium]|nr:chromosomal replication initiator protein DnaA [Bacilli bacterium]